MTKLKFLIRAIDNGFVVESNFQEHIPLRSGDPLFRVRKEFLLDEIHANTLPEAVEILKQLTIDYQKRIETANMEDKVRADSDQRTQAVCDAINSLAKDNPDGASIGDVKAALDHKYTSEEVEKVLLFLEKSGIYFTPRPGFFKRTPA